MSKKDINKDIKIPELNEQLKQIIKEKSEGMGVPEKRINAMLNKAEKSPKARKKMFDRLEMMGVSLPKQGADKDDDMSEEELYDLANKNKSTGHGPGGRGGAFIKRRAKDSKGTLLKLWEYLMGYKKGLTITIILIIIAVGVRSYAPVIQGIAVDKYLIPGDFSGLVELLIGLAVAFAVMIIADYIAKLVMIKLSQKVVRNMRKDLFAKLHTLSLRFFDSKTHGELMSRLSNDVDTVSNTLQSTSTELISNSLSVILAIVFMFVTNWKLALAALIIVPLSMVITILIASRTRKHFREQQKHLGELNGIIEETITGEKVVKAFCHEEKSIDEFTGVNNKLRTASVKAQIYSGFMMPLMNMVNNASYVLIAALGGWLAINGSGTIGNIITFLGLIRNFTRPIMSIAQQYNALQSAIAGAERVFEVMDEEPDLKDKDDAIELNDIKGNVVFKNVNFGYDKDKPILKNISMKVDKGMTIALVGPTGAGKTTIVNLLTRFYDVDSGEVLIDGHNIKDLKRDMLRQNLGIVLQDTYLFTGTVMENIRYGRLDATDEEVFAASELANAHQFIHRLTDGYETELSEQGSNLSQGQRQLLSIARAILADPSILILDEATSSVDTRTEVHIQKAMLTLMKGRTSFVIAHRLSTIRNADMILVLKDGEIIERGSHQELLAMEGFYSEMYLSQFKGNKDLVS